MTDAEADAAVRALEARRLEVVNDHRIDALGDLLADDYIHIHANGLVEDRAAAIAGFDRVPREMSRGPLDVRRHGDIAIIIGEQFNILRPPGRDEIRVKIMVSQVARLSPSGWRFVSFHGCFVPDS